MENSALLFLGCSSAHPQKTNSSDKDHNFVFLSSPNLAAFVNVSALLKGQIRNFLPNAYINLLPHYYYGLLIFCLVVLLAAASQTRRFWIIIH